MVKAHSILCLCVVALLAGCNQKDVRVADLAAHAVALSQLTLPGSSAFHLKATIFESTNPDSDYKAKVEEYWVSPEKWRRAIQSPNFSQILIVNDGKISEQDSGDYYPFWLRDLVVAIFDPLPQADQLKKASGTVPAPGPYFQAPTCARFQQVVGVAPAQIQAFSVTCFGGRRGLLESVVTPGYDAIFDKYQR